jgi:hypothetical protein
MRVKLSVFSLAIASVLLLPSRATADTYQYSYTTQAVGLVPSINITFTISAATPPASGVSIFPTSTNPLPVISFYWNSAAGGNCSSLISIPGFACAGFYSGTSGSFDESRRAPF